MAFLGPGVVGVFVILALLLTMVSLFAVTVWSFGPGRFKPPDEAKNKARREA